MKVNIKTVKKMPTFAHAGPIRGLWGFSTSMGYLSPACKLRATPPLENTQPIFVSYFLIVNV